MNPLASLPVFTSLRRRWRHAAEWISTAGLVWISLATPAWAQLEESKERTYVPSYMIIVFAVGLALLMICRTGKRTIGFRREE